MKFKKVISLLLILGVFSLNISVDFSALYVAKAHFIDFDNGVWAEGFDPALYNSPIASWSTTLFLLSNGTVKATGVNNYGQLGIGYTGNPVYTAIDIPNLTGVAQVAEGLYYSFALMRDGTVKAWGCNQASRLGINDNIDRYTPTTIPNLSGVKQIVARLDSIFTILDNGYVKAWGYNRDGQLGLGDTNNRGIPTTIPGLAGVKQIDADFNHTLALLSDGTVKAWGINERGGLGLGDTMTRYIPTVIPGLTGVKQIVAGDMCSLALMNDGTVKAWGNNTSGQLGLGDITNRYTPTVVPGLSGVRQLVNGKSTILALMSDGTVKRWGCCYVNGQYINQTVPSAFPGLNGVILLSDSFAIMSDGSVKAWGSNPNGLLGLGYASSSGYQLPTTIPGLNLFSQPVINISTPSTVNEFSETVTALVPQISVSDADNDSIKCRYYLDAESTPRDEKTVSDTASSKTINFNAIDLSVLSEGNHTIKFEASDGITATVYSTANFKIDRTAPVIGNFSVTSFIDSITVSGSATDSITRLADNPYRYTIDSIVLPWTNSTTHAWGGLSPNSRYNVVFEAMDVKGYIANKSQYIYTKAKIPELTASTPGAFSIDIAVKENNPESTQYLIKAYSAANGTQYVNQEGGLTAAPAWITLNNKAIKVTGLNPETPYKFSAKARNGENVETNESTECSCTTLIKPPAAPANLIATATNNQIIVSWDASATATGYQILVDGKEVNIGTSLSYTHTSLNPNTPHTYQVRARNVGGPGAWSTQITKSTLPTSPDIPVNVVAVPQSTSIIVTWGNVPFATGYDIEVDGALVTNGPTTNYVHSSLNPGTHHSYRVRSINSGGKSDWSVMVSATTSQVTSPVPANLTATPSKNEISLKWDSVDGATGYEVEVDGVRMDNNTRTTYIHKNLTSGSQHMYRVRSKKNGVISDWSAAAVAETLSDVFGTPTGLKADVNDTSITLNWDAVTDATGYDVEADGLIVDNGTEISALITGLEPGSPHTYRIRANSASQPSEWSELLQVTTFDLPTPIIMDTLTTETTIQITWKSTTSSAITPGNTTGTSATYELEADGSIIPDINESTYNYGGLAPGTQHVFRVRAKGENGVSNWSIPVTKSTVFSASNVPTGFFAMVKSSSAVIMWHAMEGAVSYDIEVDGVLTENITGLKYLHNGLLPGSKHTYKVRANNDTGESGWSDVLTLTIKPDGPATPTNLTASSTTSRIVVSWDQVTGADEYEIEADGVVIQIGNGTSYLQNGLIPDTQHSYRVRSKNSAGYGPWSETVSAKTRSSTMTYQVDTVTDEEFDLVFSASDIQDIGQYTFTVTYDPAKLEAVDLCSITSKADYTAGFVIGTGIQIVQFTPGTIVFKKTDSAQNYQAWSGAVNTIRFKSLADGQAEVIYSFQ